MAAFETVLMFAEVAQEILNSPADISLKDGSKFAKKFLNRTFHLPTGSLFITAGGERYPDILASQLSTELGTFQVSESLKMSSIGAHGLNQTWSA